LTVVLDLEKIIGEDLLERMNKYPSVSIHVEVKLEIVGRAVGVVLQCIGQWAMSRCLKLMHSNGGSS